MLCRHITREIYNISLWVFSADKFPEKNSNTHWDEYNYKKGERKQKYKTSNLVNADT